LKGESAKQIRKKKEKKKYKIQTKITQKEKKQIQISKIIQSISFFFTIKD